MHKEMERELKVQQYFKCMRVSWKSLRTNKQKLEHLFVLLLVVGAKATKTTMAKT